MRSSRIAEIILSAQRLPQPVRVHGASFAARAWLAARFSYESPGAVVVVCPQRDDLPTSFASDLDCLSTVVDGQSLAVQVFPTWEQSPYSPIAPSIRTRLERLKTLSLLSRYEPASQSKPVIVTLLQSL